MDPSVDVYKRQVHMLFIHGDIRGKVFFDLVEIIVHHIVPGNQDVYKRQGAR